MGASFYKVEYKNAQYVELPEGIDHSSLGEFILDTFGKESGEGGFYFYLPPREEAVKGLCLCKKGGMRTWEKSKSKWKLSSVISASMSGSLERRRRDGIQWFALDAAALTGIGPRRL